jgi:cell division topological specificity factor
MGFLDRLMGRREPTSSDIAKERLQLVLVHDRVKLSRDTLDHLKDELVRVISRYVDIEAESVEVTLAQGKRESRLVVDIPVRGPARRVPARGARNPGAGGNG